VHAHETASAVWGTQRALSLPGLTVSVREMLDALESVGGAAAVGRVKFEADERIAKIVRTWPARFSPVRALAMGFEADHDVVSIVRAYAAEYGR
jgi:nucleoside-diphosphate-sugar epimerase